MMKVSELIRALKKVPQNALVQLADFNVNADEDSLGEGSSAGCYPITGITLLEQKDVPDDTDPWVAIEFTNREYFSLTEERDELIERMSPDA